MKIGGCRCHLDICTFFKCCSCGPARTHRHNAFFALFGRYRICFCSCFVVIGSVTNFYSVLVQYDGSLVRLFGFGNHLSLLFCDDGMPYLKTFQLHIIGNYSSHLGNRRKKPLPIKTKQKLPEFPLHWHLL